MKKTQTGLLEIIEILRDGITEYFIHSQCQSLDTAPQALDELFEVLQNTGASETNVRIYTTEQGVNEITDLFNDKFQAMLCPITWISQPDKDNIYPFSLQVHAVTGTTINPIIIGTQKTGCQFSDTNARYTLLTVLPKNKNASNGDQTTSVFDQMQQILESAGMDFSNTLRTWLFADDILSWYDKLNAARDQFFTQHDIFNKLVPASTGIGVANPSGSALVTELFAAKPKNDNVLIEKIASPMQCEALDYKSSFSRATRLTAPDHIRMYVSGTASIAQTGETVFLDDTAKQIEMTLKVADALIKNGGMNWNNTVRAMAYLKDSKDFPLFDACCKQFGIDIPHVKIEADVCRDDLLFEIEMTLIAAN